MKRFERLSGNQAAAWAAKISGVDFVAAYPITPQTEVIETLADFCAAGELDAKFVRVESEHSAMAALIGASQAGLRCFSATSSQGLLLMDEMLHWASGARLPIVLFNVNRAIAPPWNIFNEHTDALSKRDTGWLQFFCSNSQEVLDTIIQAFWIAEKLCIPAMVCADGFLLSHAYEPVEIPSQEMIKEFLPNLNLGHKIELGKISNFGAVCSSPDYARARFQFCQDFNSAESIVKEAEEKFAEVFGRRYRMIEKYGDAFAESAIIIAGTLAGIAEEAVDELKKEDLKTDVFRLRSFRPFPKNDLREFARKIKKMIVVDIDPYEIIFQEVKSALYGSDSQPEMFPYALGIGGSEVSTRMIKEIVRAVCLEERSLEKSRWKMKMGEAASGPYIQTTKRIGQKNGFLFSGHGACVGCAATIPVRYATQVFGDKSIAVIPACCWTILAGLYPASALEIPIVHCAFETAAATAGAVKSAMEKRGEDALVFAYAGDGGTLDIGLQSLSGAAERGEDIIYICYDNEAYMNTGRQASSSTPRGALTETTPLPFGKAREAKDIMAIMAAHKIPYAATASVAFLDDLIRKLEKAKAKAGQGLRFLHVFCPCPPGWGSKPKDSIKLARLAVQSKAFPLYEIEKNSDGETRYVISYEPCRAVPVRDYFFLQERFAHLDDETVKIIQKSVDEKWLALIKKSKD